MQKDFQILSLIPAGFAIQRVMRAEQTLIVVAMAVARTAACRLCGVLSRRIHSRYVHQVADISRSGQKVRLQVTTHRFVCDAPLCRRRMFAERFGEVLPERSRRTSRLECIVSHLGLVLGGRPAANYAKRLMLLVSNDTLL